MMKDVIMWWFIIGIVTAFINGAIRKIDADGGLLVFAWIFFWPLTALSLTIKFVNFLYNYQPLRRLKIYYLRNF